MHLFVNAQFKWLNGMHIFVRKWHHYLLLKSNDATGHVVMQTLRRQNYLNREKERWRRDREKGRKHKVSDLSERQKRAERKKWHEMKRKQRDIVRARTTFQSVTPPPSPDSPPETENASQPRPSRLEES